MGSRKKVPAKASWDRTFDDSLIEGEIPTDIWIEIIMFADERMNYCGHCC